MLLVANTAHWPGDKAYLRLIYSLQCIAVLTYLYCFAKEGLSHHNRTVVPVQAGYPPWQTRADVAHLQ